MTRHRRPPVAPRSRVADVIAVGAAVGLVAGVAGLAHASAPRPSVDVTPIAVPEPSTASAGPLVLPSIGALPPETPPTRQERARGVATVAVDWEGGADGSEAPAATQGGTVTPTATTEPAPTPSAAPTATDTPTVAPAETPTATPSDTATPEPEPTPTETAEPTPTDPIGDLLDAITEGAQEP